MGSVAHALGLALMVALAGGCTGATRPSAEDLMWARWQQCDHHAERAAWEACMFRAHKEQNREAAAARPRPAFPVVHDWRGALCHAGAQPVRTPWDDEVLATYERIAQVAAADLPRWRAIVVADDLDDAVAVVCGDRDEFTLVVNARVLHAIRHWPKRRLLLARFVAHEVAHVALGHLHARGLDAVDMEREADELAAFYLERAGIPCRDWAAIVGVSGGSLAWLSPTAERAAIATACELAQRGERPPRRTTVTKH